MRKTKQVLAFEMLEREMEVLSETEKSAVNGGLTIQDLNQIVKVMEKSGLTSLNSNDLANVGLTFDNLLNYANSGNQNVVNINGNSFVIGGTPEWTTTAYVYPTSGGPEPLVKRVNDQNWVSFNQGQTWQPLLNTVDIVGTTVTPSYDLESKPYYNPYNDTLNFQATTLADYYSDNYQKNTLALIGTIYGSTMVESLVYPVVISNTFPSTTLVRAAVNDLLIKAVVYSTMARVIPHASGSTTIEVSNWSSSGSQFTMWLQNNLSSIYDDMRSRYIISEDADGHQILDQEKYNEYTKAGGVFQQLIQEGGVQ